MKLGPYASSQHLLPSLLAARDECQLSIAALLPSQGGEAGRQATRRVLSLVAVAEAKQAILAAASEGVKGVGAGRQVREEGRGRSNVEGLQVRVCARCTHSQKTEQICIFRSKRYV